jgi:hypothetical protein
MLFANEGDCLGGTTISPNGLVSIDCEQGTITTFSDSRCSVVINETLLNTCTAQNYLYACTEVTGPFLNGALEVDGDSKLVSAIVLPLTNTCEPSYLQPATGHSVGTTVQLMNSTTAKMSFFSDTSCNTAAGIAPVVIPIHDLTFALKDANGVSQAYFFFITNTAGLLRCSGFLSAMISLVTVVILM